MGDSATDAPRSAHCQQAPHARPGLAGHIVNRWAQIGMPTQARGLKNSDTLERGPSACEQASAPSHSAFAHARCPREETLKFRAHSVAQLGRCGTAKLIRTVGHLQAHQKRRLWDRCAQDMHVFLAHAKNLTPDEIASDSPFGPTLGRDSAKPRPFAGEQDRHLRGHLSNRGLQGQAMQDEMLRACQGRAGAQSLKLRLSPQPTRFQ